MSKALIFDPIRLPESCQRLRQEARDFLAEQAGKGLFDPSIPGGGKDADHAAFAREVAKKGWIGITWPKRYGGQARSYLERYVLTEEFRVGNAPTRRYFTADRQSGPTLMKYASEEVKDDILRKIVAGEVQFCIGLSEPNSGSDMFAAATKATKTDGGWLVNGTKVWTTNGHTADYMIGLFRTAAATSENRRHGLTNFLVDMHADGVTTNLIGQMNGVHDFTETVFDNVFIPDSHVIGEIDGASKQATTEMAYERSGPERFLETIYSLFALVERLGADPDDHAAEGIGRLVAQLHTLRRMSVSVAGMLEEGKEPTVEGSIVKDQGTIWEQRLPFRVRELAANSEERDDRLARLLPYALASAPKYTIAGGTTEVLRGIIARGLGLR